MISDNEGVSLTLVEGSRVQAKDIELGDKLDGYRMMFKINRGRRWKQWHLPAAVLRLERRGTK